MLSRDWEMVRPARRPISACSRGSVQLVRFSTGPDRSSRAIASARSPRSGEGPGASVARSASTPPAANQARQWRTDAAVTPKACASSTLVQPSSVSKIARARSASPRMSDRASSRSATACAGVAVSRDRPAMIRSHRDSFPSRSYIPCHNQRNPA